MTQQSIADLMTSSGVGFGTSGARGLVEQMTDRVCYAYTLAFVQHIRSSGNGDALAGSAQGVAIAGDLRPSTPRILAAVARALATAGINMVYCGAIPSPAVALYGLQHSMSAIMVTGSHIPDDRNGIKFNTARGEITKDDETGIREQVVDIDESLFDAGGYFIDAQALPVPDESAAVEYVQRFVNFYGDNALSGMTVGVYQHSGVARDMLVEVLEAVGASTLALGRSDSFIPVDTEAIREQDIELAAAWAAEHDMDAIVSTDGDADRPLVSDESGTWLRGDSVGCLTAHILGAGHVVTPVSSNTNVDKSGWFDSVLRSRIGSPFVIAGMESLAAAGRQGVVGYEANGGFLQQDFLAPQGRSLSPLPTRDAFIVILSLLASANSRGIKVSELVAELPQRYTYSDRIKEIPTENSKAMLHEFDSGDDEQDKLAIAAKLELDTAITDIDRTDGLRLTLASTDIVHLRPSGNAPELRCYTESDSLDKAVAMNNASMKLIKGLLG